MRQYSLEFGGLRGLQDEAELLAQLLGERRGQALVLVPHGGRCALLDHTERHSRGQLQPGQLHRSTATAGPRIWSWIHLL